MYEGDATPDHEAIAAFGLKLEEEEPEYTECWPDHWMVLQVFAALSTQWNVVQHATVGLRYEAIQAVLKMGGIAEKEHARLLQELRVMEAEALKIFNKPT
jgi:hypothetical protein